MKYSKKVSQKELCKIAKNLNAIRLTRYNCYYYEAYLRDTDKLIDRLDIDIKRDTWVVI